VFFFTTALYLIPTSKVQLYLLIFTIFDAVIVNNVLTIPTITPMSSPMPQ
jgi:hypothetical protein